MKTSCPHCRAVYRLDPAKIPIGGVRARCSRCRGIVPINRSDLQSERPAAVGAAKESGDLATVHPAEPTRAEAGSPVVLPQHGEPSTSTVPSPPAPDAGSTPGSADSGAPSGSRRRFGSPDPDERARRLARALVSDIVVYHAERRERSLREGTLREEFRAEILKSWDEYVAQVGEKKARSVPYFRDALNDILAGGTRLF